MKKIIVFLLLVLFIYLPHPAAIGQTSNDELRLHRQAKEAELADAVKRYEEIERLRRENAVRQQKSADELEKLRQQRRDIDESTDALTRKIRESQK